MLGLVGGEGFYDGALLYDMLDAIIQILDKSFIAIT